MIKVLIVEDSAVVRQHLKNILEEDGGIRVVGMAENGEESLKFVQKQKPDVITMDINMPGMNGLDATRRIMETHPVPIVIVSASFDSSDVDKSFRAMEAGALAIVEKPLGEGHSDYDSASKTLVQTVKLMSEVKVVKRWTKSRFSRTTDIVTPEVVSGQMPNNIKAVVIGASTGGPPVLQTILSGLPREFPVPILVVQHIARGFLEGMVAWLGQTTSLPIHTAAYGDRPLPGHVYFAPDNFHMEMRGNRIVLNKDKPEYGIRPSVSHLFRSAANVFGENMIGVLLTGMGKDGAEELKMMKEKGAITIVQDEESSVVHGMPGEAIKRDAAIYVLPPHKMAPALKSLTNGGCKDNICV
jgi:two-component system, chemotaxis family, protein-glutamate methylesterase/glutaminase